MDQRELLRQFCEEGIDKLRSFSRQILSVEKQDPAEGQYGEMMRLLHSLKGASRMLGLLPFGNVLHAAEEILSTLAQLQISPPEQAIDQLLKTSDILQECLAAEMNGVPTPPGEELLAELSLVQQGLTIEPDDFIAALAPLSPDVFQVLSGYQKQNLFQQSPRFAHLYEISISLRQSSFLEEVGAIHAALKENGLLISTSGSRREPEAGYDLRFNFLQLSNLDAERLDALLGRFRREIRELQRAVAPRPAAASPAPPSEPAGEPRTEEPAELKPAAEISEVPAPALPGQIEFEEEFRELQRWFLDEGEDNIRKLSQEVLALERDPSEERINSIFRSFHNFKGSGGSYRFPHITRIAHHLESYADLLRKDRTRIESAAVDAMLKGIDVLAQVIASCKEGSHDRIPIQTLEEQIVAFLNPSRPEAPALASVPAQAPQPAAGQAEGKSPLKAPESTRIDLRKVDAIVNMAVELSIAHNAEEKLIAKMSAGLSSISQRLLRAQSLLHDMHDMAERNLPALQEEVRDTYEGLMQDTEALQALARAHDRNFTSRSQLAEELRTEVLDVQLLPLETIFDSLHRIVRDLSRSLQKSIALAVSGSEVHVDRKIIDALKDPLVHLLRNAIDHGIESPDRRREAGKQPTGTIRIQAESLGYSFSITVEDDGQGLDRAKIAARAIQLGLAAEEEMLRMSDDQVYEFILRPGFTTREVVTDVSGRGVGMDVVLTNVKKFGGDIFLTSAPGRGTRIQMVLPCSLLLSTVLLIQVQGRLFSLPTGGIERIVPLSQEEIAVYKNKQTILYEGAYIPVAAVTEALRLPEDSAPSRYGIILHKGEKKLCLAVPDIVDEEELMMRPLPPHVRNIPLFSGANILPDGRISLVVNPALLSAAARAGAAPGGRRRRPRRKRLLVVDDSFVARELLKNILLTYGYEVATAGDGMDALAHARAHPIDLILSDIEMPRMDGIAFTQAVRTDASLRSIPVIILSAREDADHRRRGIEAGANAYIVKGNFTQHNLISSIEQLVPEPA